MSRPHGEPGGRLSRALELIEQIRRGREELAGLGVELTITGRWDGRGADVVAEGPPPPPLDVPAAAAPVAAPPAPPPATQPATPTSAPPPTPPAPAPALAIKAPPRAAPAGPGRRKARGAAAAEPRSAGRFIPTYDLGGARTRGEAAGDVMPVNGARIPPRPDATPDDVRVDFMDRDPYGKDAPDGEQDEEEE
jgi:hypothetical protein